ncbi:nodulation protein NfeD [Ferrimonas sediminicola]|uniref:Nodulation protein NfeD n=1 Tax=Ferrimonas sediminicola TaxID=2569538 RepID=A0A4U1B981_9GAMM|nr:nodulation protein NfeD [Ferrimonas sediminicola]TKB46560.1 nodulation protein NfeD [Ferrimonas sediminicola]
MKLGRLLALLIPIALLLLAQPRSSPGAQVWVLPIQGVIGPATSELLLNTLEDASRAQVALLVLAVDTPGGLDTAMREMIQGILASPVPVAGYVSPPGARAASAGTYLLYACHIAAMAPATNLGAATPVALSPTSSPAPPGGPKEQQAPSNEQSMRNKVVNDAVAYIRGLAELRGRNLEWAEKAVREGASLPAAEAAKLGVIDLVAEDLTRLLSALEGRRIGEHSLTLKGLEVVIIEPGWRHRLLQVLTNPNVALLLLMLGFYGLVLEFYSPGVGLPAIVGGISLLLGLYALNLLPINLAGAALMLLGLALMITEAFLPSFGLFGIGGVVAFLAGALLLMDTDVPELQLALPLVSAVAVASALFTVLVLRMALKSRRQSVVTGIQTLIGKSVTVDDRLASQGMVELGGELWQARSDGKLHGTQAIVVAVEGLTLVLADKETNHDG